MICDQWQVVAVPFPFMEMPASKRRPALIISSHTFNEENGHSVMAMITTAKEHRWPSDYALKNHKEAGLNHDCIVRWKLFTLPNSLIAKNIGQVSAADKAALLLCLKQIIPQK